MAGPDIRVRQHSVVLRPADHPPGRILHRRTPLSHPEENPETD